MTDLGIRPKRPRYPLRYKGFWVYQDHGRIYGLPGHLDRYEIKRRGLLATHPAVLSAPSRRELEALIDRSDPAWHSPQVVGRYERYDLVRLRDAVYGVPHGASAIDLDREDDRHNAGVIVGKTAEEVREAIRRRAEAVPVEFAGWLPIYGVYGDCGRHPQFRHTAEPPPGYRFARSAPPKRRPSRWPRRLGALCRKAARAARGVWQLFRPAIGLLPLGRGNGPRNGLRVLGAMTRLGARLLWHGTGLWPAVRFLASRHYQSQLLLARSRRLTFLTSMPYTFNQNPWVVEVEDPITLFYPLVQNGATYALNLRDSPYFPAVKALLESDQCRGILTHVESTARLIATLFGSDKVRAKVRHVPLGVRLPERWQRHEAGETIDLVFTNSWHQLPSSLYLRGGLDVLEAFAVLHERYPRLRLTLRTRLPVLDRHYHRILEGCWVRVVNRFLAAEELGDLLAGSHIFLLPAARIHVVSLLQAMSYGLAVVTSDGWGIEEYVRHEHNGLIVKGRYGTASWADEQAGMLREDYDEMCTPNPRVVMGLVEAVSRLVEEPDLRRRLGHSARRDVETTYNLERWNRGLKEVLDQARFPGAGPRPVVLGPDRFHEEMVLPRAEPDRRRAERHSPAGRA